MSAFERAETIRNDGLTTLVLTVEPWACEFSIAPGEVYVVRAKSDLPGVLEMERVGSSVTCWAWVGSTAEVWTAERLVISLDQPVPDVPQGRSVRRFIRQFLGRGEID